MRRSRTTRHGTEDETTKSSCYPGVPDEVDNTVTTCGELDRAIARAETDETGAYIEVVTDKYVAPPLALKIHEARGTLSMQ